MTLNAIQHSLKTKSKYDLEKNHFLLFKIIKNLIKIMTMNAIQYH
jgi:hypothetical protein